MPEETKSLFGKVLDFSEIELEVLWEYLHGNAEVHKAWIGSTYRHEVIDYLVKRGATMMMSFSSFGRFLEGNQKVADMLKSKYPNPPTYFFHVYKYKGCLLNVIAEDLSVGRCDRHSITVVGPTLDIVNGIEGELATYKEKPETLEKLPSFGILHSSDGSIEVKEITLDKAVTVDLALNYGKEFPTKHEALMKKLVERQNGLYLLHGIPGSGKTTYLKYLAQELASKDKKFIFVPTNQIDALTSPNILPVLLDNKNSVLVLEDAERAVISRESGGDGSVVSTLLNFGDGILGSMLKISLIVTFNTSKEKIDAALKRKGRLLFEHQFDKLSLEDTKTLAAHLKKPPIIDEPMTLADIYNLEDENYATKEEVRRMGFGA